MNATLADVFALYVKTKNFYWHMSGPHFRDYHLLLDEHADQPFAMTDPIAERVRKQAFHHLEGPVKTFVYSCHQAQSRTEGFGKLKRHAALDGI